MEVQILKKRIAALCILTAVSLFGCQSKESYFDKAQSQLEKSEYEDALENYNKAIMEDDNLALSYRGAGISAFMLADYDKAEDYLLRALKESKGVVGEQEVDLSLYLAETYINKGENDKALEVYTNIIDFDSSNTDARICRGILYAREQDTENAKKDFAEAVKQEDASLGLYYQIYQALAGLDSQEADKYLKKGLECKDDDMESIYMKACLYNASGDTDTALEYFNKSKSAGYAKASFMIGKIYENQGDLAAAISNYDDYIKVSNVSADEYVQIINCRINAGDKDGAKADCESAVSNADASQLKYLKFQQVIALEKMGEFEEAKEKIVQYLSQYPDDEKAQHESEFLQTR